MKKPPCFSDIDSQKLQALDFTWTDMLKLGLKLEGPYLMPKEVQDKIYFNASFHHLQLDFSLDDQAYVINSQLLNHSKITALNREKLKSWLLNETKNAYCRETYTTASRYLDMFFMHKQDVLKSDFQSLGLACLILASKSVQSRVPSISYQVFNKDKIFRFQKILIKVFNFKLNPITYIQIAEQLLFYWDTYLKNQNKFTNVIYFKDQKKSVKRVRAIFETLDCLDLVLKSLDFNLIDLVACTFFVQHRKFCLQNQGLKLKNKGSIKCQDTNFTSFHLEYISTMQKFFEDLKLSVPLFHSMSISDKTILYVLQFSRINPKIKINCYKKFREQVLRQTFNEQISHIAQKILQRKT